MWPVLSAPESLPLGNGGLGSPKAQGGAFCRRLERSGGEVGVALRHGWIRVAKDLLHFVE